MLEQDLHDPEAFTCVGVSKEIPNVLSYQSLYSEASGDMTAKRSDSQLCEPWTVNQPFQFH